MAKTISDTVLDAALNYLKNNVTRVAVCSSQPTTYTEGLTTYKLAIATVAASDLTVADDTSGRKVTAAAKSGVTIDSSGTATHIAWLDVSNTALLFVTTCTSQALVAGGTVDIPAHKYNIQDPT